METAADVSSYEALIKQAITDHPINWEMVKANELRSLMDQVHQLLRPTVPHSLTRESYCFSRVDGNGGIELSNLQAELESKNLHDKAKEFSQYYATLNQYITNFTTTVDVLSEKKINQIMSRKNWQHDLANAVDQGIIKKHGQNFFDELMQGKNMSINQDKHEENKEKALLLAVKYISERDYYGMQQSLPPIVYMFTQPKLIEQKFYNFTKELRYKLKKKEDILEIVAYAHCTFQSIHPYIDGNKTCARALMNILLHTKEKPKIYFEKSEYATYKSALFQVLFHNIVKENEKSNYNKSAFKQLLAKKIGHTCP